MRCTRNKNKSDQFVAHAACVTVGAACAVDLCATPAAPKFTRLKITGFTGRDPHRQLMHNKWRGFEKYERLLSKLSIGEE
jgi:hypothetical protein